MFLSFEEKVKFEVLCLSKSLNYRIPDFFEKFESYMSFMCIISMLLIHRENQANGYIIGMIIVLVFYFFGFSYCENIIQSYKLFKLARQYKYKKIFTDENDQKIFTKDLFRLINTSLTDILIFLWAYGLLIFLLFNFRPELLAVIVLIHLFSEICYNFICRESENKFFRRK